MIYLGYANDDIYEDHAVNAEKTKKQWNAYYQYLDSIQKHLPPETLAFAKSSWHYDFSDHKSPHDSWVESLNIVEVSSGKRHEKRRIDFNLRLLGAYHDGFIELHYANVESYSINKPPRRYKQLEIGHGDWRIDEIRLSDQFLVIHEIEFREGGNWLIECADIIYKWEPIS